jgi:hypothetical protein
MISRHLCDSKIPLSTLSHRNRSAVRKFSTSTACFIVRRQKNEEKSCAGKMHRDRHKIPHRSMKISDWSVKIKFNSNFSRIRTFLRVRSEFSKNELAAWEIYRNFINEIHFEFYAMIFPTRVVKKKKLRNKTFLFEDMTAWKRKKIAMMAGKKLFSPNSISLWNAVELRRVSFLSIVT